MKTVQQPLRENFTVINKYAMLRNWKVNINVSSSQNDLYRFTVNQTELSEAIREVDSVLYMEMQRT